MGMGMKMKRKMDMKGKEKERETDGEWCPGEASLWTGAGNASISAAVSASALLRRPRPTPEGHEP